VTNRPADPAPGDGQPTGEMPGQVRLAAILLLGLGGLLGIVAILLFVGRGWIAESVAEGQQALGETVSDTDALSGDLALVALVFAVLAALSIFVGYFVRQGRPWARLAGIGFGALLGVLGVRYLLAGVGDPVSLVIPVGALGVAVTVVSGLLSGAAAVWFRDRPA